MSNQKILALVLLFVTGLTNAYSQTDTLKLQAYEDLSLKDLLNVKITSVSKETELLFDAPLSASVVTKEEIRKTGCTSVMEALRLVPGMIVREQNNGNYDIHLRGMDNVPPNSAFDITSNTTTLVMIDNRPIYSYLKGGTFWETFPVDINDVEKIEVIRGPAAALYGPNAVNGVINIITRQVKHDGLYTVANAQKGSYKTNILNASVGYKFNNAFNILASANYQGRDRTQTSYFEFVRNQWMELPPYFISFNGDTIRNVNQRYPDADVAMEKYAGNVFANYSPASKIRFSLSAGAQHSIGQRVSTENEITPFSSVLSASSYADLHINIDKLSAQFSYNNGTQLTDRDPGNKYAFNTFDGNVEYNYTIGRLSLKPGLSFRSAVYDDTKYSDIIAKTGIFNAKGILTTQTASLRAEYKLFADKLRLVAGIRADKFNYPDTTYISTELAATYKLDKHNLIRAVYSTSPRSASIFDTYVDQTVAYFPIGRKKFAQINLEGNKNLKLLTANMFEVGYRSKLSNNFDADIEVFDIRASNYLSLVTTGSAISLRGTDTVLNSPIKSLNLPATVHQQGVTISINYSIAKFQFKPFITLQKTNIKNYSPYNNTADALLMFARIAEPSINNMYSAMGVETRLKSTPTSFGGASANYAVTSKLNASVNAYYYSQQTYTHLTYIFFRDGVRGIDNIDAKLILNAGISYQALKGLHIFCNGKNILNQKSREFFRTDAVPFMLLAGLNYEL